jgi:hypothetical protein
LNIDKNIKDKKDLTDQNTPDDLKISNNFLEKTGDKRRDKLPQLKYHLFFKKFKNNRTKDIFMMLYTILI